MIRAQLATAPRRYDPGRLPNFRAGQPTIAPEMQSCNWTVIEIAPEYLALARWRLACFRQNRKRFAEFCHLAA